MAEPTAEKAHADAATASTDELAGVAAIEELAGGDMPEDGDPVVRFNSPFFNKLQLAYFRYLENTTETVFVVEYGSQQVALPLSGVRKELELHENDADWRMLDLIAKGLRYVTTLAVGDPLPSEIITGKASWPLSPKHAQVAYQRLALKLMSWMTQDKVDTATATNAGEDIIRQTEDPEVRKKIAAAFDEAAEALGLGRGRREEVVGFLEALAQELGYIEALRDKFARIVKVGRRLKEFQALGKRSGAKSQRVADVVDQAAKLIRPAVDQFVQLFKDTDALTDDIMAVLRDLDGHITRIQGQRDEIHQRLTPWNDILDAWEKIKDSEITAQVVNVAARTVRMLAPRYMPAKEWVLRLKEDQMRKAKIKSWRSPDQQHDDAHKVAGRIMRW
jgi:plasmid stabilization system protein ParE